ncbi:MAG: DUF357 domain-containing protein [Archaeoglobaceae archaeon]|nr:DUF357 domain-containing protein [Archaeoglobaceae archaeon]MDW7990149.1 DUF357 domain-containing protein [Archaeoglobaceae archaeon]
MKIEEALKLETKKWIERLKERLSEVKGDKRFIRNIKAYFDDSNYFLDKGDFIRAFECIVWAWAWLEIGLEVGKIEIGTAHADKQENC